MFISLICVYLLDETALKTTYYCHKTIETPSRLQELN